MKIKFFLYGLRVGMWFANTLPFAFISGIIFAFTIYARQMETNVENADRQKQWQDKLAKSAYKPEQKG